MCNRPEWERVTKSSVSSRLSILKVCGVFLGELFVRSAWQHLDWGIKRLFTYFFRVRSEWGPAIRGMINEGVCSFGVHNELSQDTPTTAADCPRICQPQQMCLRGRAPGEGAWGGVEEEWHKVNILHGCKTRIRLFVRGVGRVGGAKECNGVPHTLIEIGETALKDRWTESVCVVGLGLNKYPFNFTTVALVQTVTVLFRRKIID